MWTRIINLFKYLIVLSIIYASVTSLVFAYRHPWATDMERLIYLKEALTFKKVSYKEMRSVYEK